ncbi:MAG: tetratricopeptide repeat protein [Myxococcales bacterium]|nr:tetratricopeptide repeat protein [Myxococcales bacterium]
MKAKCRMTEAIAQAFPAALDEALRSHLQDCPVCQAEWQALSALRSLALQIPVEQPDAQRRDAVRARLLYQAERLRHEQAEQANPADPQPRRAAFPILRWAALAAAVAFGVGLGLWSKPIQPRRPTLPTVMATHTDVSAQGSGAPSLASITPTAEPANRASSAAPRPEAAIDPPLAAPGRAQIDAQITAHGLARYDRERIADSEIVRLHQGRVQFQVQRLPSTARFIVRVGDAEVEVKGTRFTVFAEQGRLQRVEVERGLVEVRVPPQASTLLAAGQTWQAAPARRIDANAPTAGRENTQAAASSRLVMPAEPKGPSRHRSQIAGATQPSLPSVASSPASALGASMASPSRPAAGKAATARSEASPVSPAEQAFLSGFAALKQGRYVPAANDLERAVTLAPAGPVAEDARFWSAVAWGRAGRTQEAAASLRAFLAQHPQSPRQPEAAAALGWLLLRERKLDEAERVLRTAHPRRTTAVAESLRSALSAIAAARGQP